MFENHLYNLFAQITEEHKSLWRIKEFYLKDAATSLDDQAFWNKVALDKETLIKELEEKIKSLLV
jgi:hypothetical protein